MEEHLLSKSSRPRRFSDPVAGFQASLLYHEGSDFIHESLKFVAAVERKRRDRVEKELESLRTCYFTPLQPENLLFTKDTEGNQSDDLSSISTLDEGTVYLPIQSCTVDLSQIVFKG